MFLAQIVTDVTTFNAQYMASLAGIVALTLLIVQYAVKPLGVKFAAVDRVPTLVYTIAIAVGLTFLANRVLKTLPGDNLWLLIENAVVMAFSASGVYVAGEAAKPLSVTKKPAFLTRPPVKAPAPDRWQHLVPLLVLPAIFLTGCAATTSPFYNGVKAQWPAIRDPYLTYIQNDPNRPEQSKAILRESVNTMDDLIAKEGARLAPPATQP